MKAHARTGRPSRKSSRKFSVGNTLTGLVVGLIVGILVAAVFVWYLFKTPTPFSNKFEQPAKTAGNRRPPDQTAPTGPIALPGKPGDPIPQPQSQSEDGKPRFDFYKILPGQGEATPSEKENAKTADSKTGNEKPGTLVEPMFLQIGSYLNPAEADGQKARLAMLGIEATVHQVMLQDKVWYRVRLGPFRRLDEVNNMRSELAKQGISASVIKKE